MMKRYKYYKFPHYLLFGMMCISSLSYAQEKLEFDDLEHYQPDVNQAMLNEIYQVAEQAKKDAQIWLDTGTSVSSAQIDKDKSVYTFEKIDVENQKPPVNVDELIKTIQQDSVSIAQNVQQKEENYDDIFKDTMAEEIDASQLSWFQRWKMQRKLPEVKKENYIRVDVENVDSTALKDNLVAKLETLTVESVQDFNAILPQIKKLTNQAAQAVGYYDVEFGSRLSKDGKRLTINRESPEEPVRVQNQAIEFTGAGEYLPQFQIVNVVPDLDVGDIFNHGLYENTKTRITDAASSNGFFDAYWRLHDVKVTLPEKTADINLKYETGERYQLGDVIFRMSDVSKPLPIDEKILREMITWKEGDNYTDWRVNLFSNYLTNSRFFNSVSVNVMKPDPIEKTLDLPPDLLEKIEKQNIDVDAKPVSDVPNVDETQFAGVGDTQQTGNAENGVDNSVENSVENTLESHLDKNLTLQAEQQSQAYEQAEEQRLKQQARETKQIPVVVTLNADKLNNLETGIGYGTDTGFRTRLQYRRAFLNRMGYSLQGNIELSQIRQAGEMRYYIPHYHPINRYFTLLGGYERDSDFSVGQGMSLVTETAVAGVDYALKNQKFDAWQHNFGLRYRLDRLTVNGDVNIFDIPREFLVVKGEGTQQSLLASYKASKIYANSATNPTQGFRHNYQVELGSKHLLTDVDLAILSAGMSFIYSFGDNDNHQVLGRANGSYMFTNDFAKVPYNLRFFAGGDQSLRGFDYKSLSPTENGIKIGGQALAVGSMEYNYQIFDGWRLGVFSDFGNSFDEKFSNPLAYSVGLGVRWQSPVGPIRIDVASGISDANKPIRLHFFIGSPLQ